MNRLLLICYCFLTGLILFMAKTDNSKTLLVTPSKQNKVTAVVPSFSLQVQPTDTAVASLRHHN